LLGKLKDRLSYQPHISETRYIEMIRQTPYGIGHSKDVLKILFFECFDIATTSK